jgi:hypothetical protein
MTDWNIQQRARACTACGKPFADKAPYHTLLFDERAEFRRSDVCPQCWESQYSNGARERKGFISYWQGIYEAPPPPNEPIQKTTALSLLRELIERNDPQYVATAYILTAMLERKRLLKIKEQLVREGRRLFVYEEPKSGDVFSIVDPDLQLNHLEAVQREVAALLEHGLNPPPNSGPQGAPVAPGSLEGSAAAALEAPAVPETADCQPAIERAEAGPR